MVLVILSGCIAHNLKFDDTAAECGEGMHLEGDACVLDVDTGGDSAPDSGLTDSETGSTDSEPDTATDTAADTAPDDSDPPPVDCSMGGAVDAPTGVISLADADATVVGDGPYLALGDAVAGAGDADGDGCGDLLEAEPNAPRFALFRGPLAATADASAAWAWWTATAADGTPYTMASGGDLDGDHVPDLVLAAYSHGVFLVSGPVAAGEHALGDANTELWGRVTQNAGIGVAFAGDVTGDGTGDLLVSGLGGNGVTWIVPGPIAPGSFELDTVAVTLEGEDLPDGAGGGLAALGDFDGDGLPDFAIGAQGAADSTGRAYLFYGPAPTSNGSVADADAIFEGIARGDEIGRPVAAAGDTNGDGRADLLIGSLPNGSGKGEAYLVLGATLSGVGSVADADTVFTGDENGDQMGDPVSSAGDVDGDGHPDLLFGATYSARAGHGAGAAFLVYSPAPSGSVSLSAADAIFEGAVEGESAGSAVAAAGDLDRDGFADLAIGAENYAYEWSGQGAAYVVRGGTR